MSCTSEADESVSCFKFKKEKKREKKRRCKKKKKEKIPPL